MAAKIYDYITPEQVDHFMTYGWIMLSAAFTKEQADAWTENLWTRLGYDKDDKTSWLLEKINMPSHSYIDVRTFAPNAWKAICDLTGGEERLDPASTKWADAFIVNFGSEATKGTVVAPRDLDNWHVDGDFFIHYLDSSEQGLLVIPVLSDIAENGGGIIFVLMVSVSWPGTCETILRESRRTWHAVERNTCTTNSAGLWNRYETSQNVPSSSR